MKYKKYIFTVLIPTIATSLLCYTQAIIADASAVESYTEGHQIFSNYTWLNTIGRFGYKIVSYFNFSAVNPYINLFIFVITASIVSVVLIELWNVDSKLCQVLITLCMTVSPFAICGFTLQNHMFFWVIAMLLSSLSAYALFLIENKILSIVISVACLVFATSIYQDCIQGRNKMIYQRPAILRIA